MGTGILIGQETKLIKSVESQTLQSAYKNGVLTNAKDVSLNNYKAVINRPHLVNSNSTDTPTDMSWGIREVFFYDNSNIIIQITGIDTDNNVKIWHCVGSMVDSTFTTGSWVTLGSPISSAGSDEELGLTKLYSSTGSNADGTMTQKALTEQFANYLETEKVDNYLAVFQDSEPDSDSTARFWVNTTESTTDIEQITVPQIDDTTTTAFDTWSSNKIDNEFSMIGRYAIFGGINYDITLKSSSITQYISIQNVLVNKMDANSYITCGDGYIVVQPGIYLVTGKIQILDTSAPVTVIADWVVSEDNKTYKTTYETQVSENHTYIASTLDNLNAKIILNPMVLNLKTTTYLRPRVMLHNDANVVISQGACRFQITKLK